MDNILKVVSRIKRTSDGPDFMAYLDGLSKKNYLEWKNTTSEVSDILKGKAFIIDELIKLFETCDDKLRNSEGKTQEWL